MVNLNSGYIEEYGINLLEDVPVTFTNKFYSEHKGPLTKAERISDQVILCLDSS